MALGFQNQPNTRVMFTSATAETAYPTGVSLGLKGQADAAAGDVNGAADTRTTTQADCIFYPDSTTVIPQKGCYVRSIEIIEIGTGAGPTIKLQDVGGQKDLTPTITAATRVRVEFGIGGMFVAGGFRTVTTGATTAPLCAITYDLVPN